MRLGRTGAARVKQLAQRIFRRSGCLCYAIFIGKNVSLGPIFNFNGIIRQSKKCRLLFLIGNNHRLFSPPGNKQEQRDDNRMGGQRNPGRFASTIRRDAIVIFFQVRAEQTQAQFRQGDLRRRFYFVLLALSSATLFFYDRNIPPPA